MAAPKRTMPKTFVDRDDVEFMLRMRGLVEDAY
jgi:hypothetical protein